jgi:cytochrome c
LIKKIFSFPITSKMISRVFSVALHAAVLYLLTSGISPNSNKYNRPQQPWAIRSVLDKQPRMLTLALDTACYIAYDLEKCSIRKVWKGGISLDGAAYTDKKTIQPTSWGASYINDSLHQIKWYAKMNGKASYVGMIYKGYRFKNEQIYLKFGLVLPNSDTLVIEERPEFVRSKSNLPGIERVFYLDKLPSGVSLSLVSTDTIVQVGADKPTRLVKFFNPLPKQQLPPPTVKAGPKGRAIMEKSDCLICHEMNEPAVGPSFMQVAARYNKDKKEEVRHLVQKIRNGGSGAWGQGIMNPHPNLSDDELNTVVDYILALKPKGKAKGAETTSAEKVPESQRSGPIVPEGLHPSYNLQTIHKADFKPRVGAMAFMPDGRLLVTTWDRVGGVYLLDGVQTGDSSRIGVKCIASGLAEPLGIEVVDGVIYVLQKHELTRLVDVDGDDIIDEYQAVCSSWTVSDDFHEFAFGLLYKEGYFYITLSMAMRLESNARQLADRGKLLKIGKDGKFETVIYGLRTPNGIGAGMDNEIFVTDNQGQWLPANKLIHVKKGEYHGMAWGLPASVTSPPKMAPPAIWLPQNEIGNSPSEPVLILDGIFKGQLLHGDVTHGGIKRDFLEIINNDYQGAVFHFTQGLEAGVNRMRWGKDGALYIGGIGMGGSWGHKGKNFGLQRMEFNGKSTFEMLAIRARPHGFEIEFTAPLKKGQQVQNKDFDIKQWWYEPTSAYGGPKKDLEDMEIREVRISPDRTRVYLEIPGLKKGHVVYFGLSDRFKSEKGQPLWASEAWYTLNQIPQL